MTDETVSKAIQVNTLFNTMPRPANTGHIPLSTSASLLTSDAILDVMVENLTNLRKVIETKFTISLKERAELGEIKAELECMSRLLKRVLPEKGVNNAG